MAKKRVVSSGQGSRGSQQPPPPPAKLGGEATAQPQRAVPGDIVAESRGGAVPDRRQWRGEPGPPWPPNGAEPLRVLLHGGIGVLDEFEAYAAALVARTEREVEWLITVEHDEETGGVQEALSDLGEVVLLPPGPCERMFWIFYRHLRDFRPHIMHCCTRLGREFAKVTGQRWVYVNIGEAGAEEGITGCIPAVLTDDDPDELYEMLLARPADIMIVTRNHADLAMQCLSHVAANTWWPHRLLVLDNGSDDAGATAAVLKSFMHMYGTDRCLSLWDDDNLGCAHGRNRLYRHVENPFLAVLDDDMLVPAGWLGTLMEVMDSQPNAGLVAPWCEVYQEAMRDRDPFELDAMASNNLYRTEAVRAAEETQGTFYEEPFASCQGRSDTDLNYRVKEAGWDLWFDGRVSLHHLGGPLVRMAGLTRRFGDGKKMKQGDWECQQKWVRPGIRRVAGGEGSGR
jgi:hypothetical protein